MTKMGVVEKRKKSTKRPYVTALESAKPAQLMKIRAMIERANQSSQGFLIFYSEDALKPFDKRQFSHHAVERAIQVIGEEEVADVLLGK